jgi:hypothetical protein
MPLIERPDVAKAHAAERNAAVSPNVLAEAQENFGAVVDVPIYFYNVGPMEFSEPRYPNHPRFFIPACPPGKPYVQAKGSITHPFREIREDQNGNRFPVLTNGYREAAKMLNPMNPGLDQDYHEPSALNVNGNLNRMGVFWSVNNPPKAEELAAARARLEETFRQELSDMVSVETQEGPEGARARANRLSRAAASYFGQSYSWHRTDLVPKDVNVGKVPCWACGEEIRPAALLCMHCGAPMAEAKRASWLEQKFAEKKVRPSVPPAEPAEVMANLI